MPRSTQRRKHSVKEVQFLYSRKDSFYVYLPIHFKEKKYLF